MEVRGELTSEAQEAAEDAASDLKADDELSTVDFATDDDLDESSELWCPRRPKSTEV